MKSDSKKPMGQTGKGSFFVVMLTALYLLLALAGCSNMFENPGTGNQTPPEGGSGLVAVTGQVSLSGAFPGALQSSTGSRRTAIPMVGAVTYTVTAQNKTDSGKTVTVAVEDDFSYTLYLSPGNWTLSCSGVNDSGSQIIREKSPVELTVTQGGATPQPGVLELVLPQTPVTGGAGDVSLNGTIDFVKEGSATVTLDITLTPWNSAVTAPDIPPQTITDNGNFTVKVDDVPSGVYIMRLVFSVDGIPVSTVEEAVNVFDNMTTDTWYVGGGNSDHLTPQQDGSAEFNLTRCRTEFFINGSGGDDTNPGSALKPLKTLGKAFSVLGKMKSAEAKITLQGDAGDTAAVTAPQGVNAAVSGEQAAIVPVQITVGNGATVKVGTNVTCTGGALVQSGGSLTLTQGGTIDGTSLSGIKNGSGGAVYVDGGTFTMENGSTVTGGSVSANGGAVYVSSGTFTMDGGTITRGNASGNGGGVYVSGGIFEMSGGSVSGNEADTNGGGVFVDGTGAFTVSGTPTITGNTVNGTPNNVYLPSGKTITIGDDGFTGGTVGVTAEEMKAGSAVQITDTNVLGAGDRFDSDISPYSIAETIATTDGGIAVFLSDADVSYQESSAVARSLGALSDAVSETNKWTSGGTITLMKNINGTNAVFSTGPITFSGGTSASPVILNLNGKTINRGLETATSDGMVIKISGGALTIQDSSSGGKITGGYTNKDLTGSGIHIDSGSVIMTGGEISGNGKDSSLKGGGVFIKNGGAFRMQGGSIANNQASNGGGVYLNGGTFTITGGSINGNKANNDGGGVYMNSGTFTINDGSINGNTAGQNGGGVYLLGGKVTIDSHGGSINGNTASQNGGGIYFSGGDFIIGKEIKEDASQNDYILFEIRDNNCSGIENNLYVKDGAPLIQLYTQLGRFNNDGSVRDGEQSIGISMETKGNFAIKKADPSDDWPYWDVMPHFFFSDLDKNNEGAVDTSNYPYWKLQ